MEKIEEYINIINNIDIEIELLMNPIKEKLSKLNFEKSEINTKLNEEITSQSMLQLDNKPYKCGTANIHAGKFLIKTIISKKVDWDEKVLLDIEKKIIEAGKDPKDYIKYKLSVNEKDYGKFSDEIKDVFKKARSVKPSKPSITYLLDDVCA